MITPILPATSFQSRSEVPGAVRAGPRALAGLPQLRSPEAGSTKRRGGTGAGAGRAAAGLSVCSIIAGAGSSVTGGASFFPDTLMLALHLGQWNFFPSGGGASSLSGTPQDGQVNRIGGMVVPPSRKYEGDRDGPRRR